MNLRTTVLKLVLLCLLPSVVLAQRYLEVSEFYAKVYVAPLATSKIIGLAQKNEKFQILGANGPWYRIHFKNSYGWIYNENVKMSEANAQAPVSASKPSQQQVQSPPPPTQIQQVAQTESTSDSIKLNQSAQSTPVSAVNMDRGGNTQPTFINNEQKKDKPFFKPFKKKQDESAASWFTQQSLDHLPPSPDGQSGQELEHKKKYFQLNSPAPVLTELSPNSAILGIARAGDLLPIVGEGESWCKVAFNDSIGWIEKRKGKVVEPGAQKISNSKILFMIAGFSLLIVLVIIVIYLFSTIKSKRKKDFLNSKNVLIIAKSQKSLPYTLTEGTTTLEQCFSEIGYTIAVARDTPTIRTCVDHTTPDVVLIDWHFDKNIKLLIESFFGQKPSTSNALFIFYNVHDEKLMIPSRILPNVNFLSLSFSDQDLFKLITPSIIKSEKQKTIQKSVNASALEGDIAGGNLIEVLQFIEIGHKSGCMLIETRTPFGMIYFEQGRIVYAASEGISGRDAIFAMLNLKNGKFRFVVDRMPKQTNVNISTLEVLMEWTKAVDENTRH